MEMLSVSKDSHNVGKPAVGGGAPFRRDWQAAGTQAMQAPTIRVIHIFAPKIIKTDVANFRSTVQKLTGKSTRKSQRRARTKTVSDVVAEQDCALMAASQGCASLAGQPQWDQETAQKEVLQRLVVDACGTDHLHRSNSGESTTFSMESNTSNDTADLSSPSDFTFPSCTYLQGTQAHYSLGAIPAPFFGSLVSDMVQPSFPVSSPTFSHPSSHGSVGMLDNALQLPPVMDNSFPSFEVDTVETALGPSLLSDVPFSSSLGGAFSGGGLYDLMHQQQYCRLSAVHQSFQGGAFFDQSI